MTSTQDPKETAKPAGTRNRSRTPSKPPSKVPVRAPGKPSLEGLSAAQRRALLVKLMKRQGAPELFPLSFPQRRLWFLEQLEGAGHFLIQQSLHLKGSLRLSALEKAVAALVARHGALRTVFIADRGDPRQAVLPRQKPRLTVLDFQALAPSARREVSRRWLKRTSQQPFELERGPLLRVFVVALGPREHLLSLQLHHIVSDAWSMEILGRELGELYGLYCSKAPGEVGRNPLVSEPLPALTTSYGAFSRWQQERLTGSRLESLVSHWRQRLASAAPLLELPTDRPRPAVASWRGELFPFQLPSGTVQALERFASRRGATPFMVFLAAFLVWLARLSGRRDPVVGTPVAGRPRSELEGIVGFFVNSLVLRAPLAEAENFRQVLDRTSALVLEALDHAELPFERLVEALAPPRDLGYAPLFQVAFQLQGMSLTGPSLKDLETEVLEVDSGTADLDLSVYLEPRNGGLQGFAQFRSDLFDPTTIDRWMGHYRQLCGRVALQPDAPLGELSLLSPAQEQQLLEEWGQGPTAGTGTETVAAADTTDIVEEIFRRARQNPAAMAVVTEQEKLTYGELAGAVETLAKGLLSLGLAKEETVVGVCLERSPRLVVSMLAVLKVGAAYLPLDPAYPPQRLAHMVTGVGASSVGFSGSGSVGSGSRLSGSRVSGPRGVVVLVDGSTAQALPRSLSPSPCKETPSDSLPIRQVTFEEVFAASKGQRGPASGAPSTAALAYVLFTSGSTGLPKGVGVSREALTQHCQGIVSHYRLEPRDVVLQFASSGFDTSLEQLIPALAAGARVVMRSDEVWSATQLAQRLEDEKVTVANLPTAYWQQVTAQWLADSVALPVLRLVVAGGEALAPAGLSVWHRWVGSRSKVEADGDIRTLAPPRLLNAYGPTEGVVTATTFDAGAWQEGGEEIPRVPVGSPLAGRRVRVLDSSSRLVAPGVSGQLFLGGAGLARGYVDDCRHTAQRFLPDPHALSPGERVYATGDLARFRSDGALEILGRTDRQKKVRGFRVEPGEVEAALEADPSVAQAAAEVRGQGAEARLLAWVVAAAEEVDGVVLRARLAHRLPDYLVPSQVISMAELPLTAHGKVDLASLPEPTGGGEVELDRSLGKSPLLEILGSAWKELLPGVPITSESHFFEAGGHSLLATQLVARVERLFSLQLPVREIFRFPRLADLSRRLEQLTRAAVPPGKSGAADSLHLFSSEIDPMSRRTEASEGFPLSYSQERLWFLDRMNPGSPLYNIAGLLHLEGPLQVQAFESALESIEDRHEPLRTLFRQRDGEVLQWIEPSGRKVDGAGRARFGRLPLVDLSALTADHGRRALRALAQRESQRPFDLEQGPLWRVHLVRLAEGIHSLLAVFHHIVSDGWSQGVFFRELGTFYRKSSQGSTEGTLPPLPVQYVDYARWQRQSLESESSEALVEFWRQRLSPSPPPLELPSDRPRGAVQSFQGDFLPLELSARLTTDLHRLADRRQSTLFMVLLTALRVVLWRLSGQRDVVVGTPVANRRRVELEGLMGFFVNTLAIRSPLEAGTTFEEQLAEVRERTLEAFAHEDLPFEKMVEALRPRRDLAHTPFFQVMLAYQAGAEEEWSLPGLETRLEALSTKTAKFEVTAYLQPVGDGLGGVLEYNRDLFDPTTVERLAGHFRTVLAAAAQRSPEGALSGATRAVEELPWLSQAQRQQVELEWNATHRDLRLGRALHWGFELRAAEAPEAVAVEGPGGEQLTYGELEAKANQLAHYLAAQGVRPESRIAVALERSTELMVALLAVLKVGAAYVPLDPDYPQERLAFMVRDAEPAVVLTTVALWPRLGAPKATVVCLSEAAENPLEVEPGREESTGASVSGSGVSGFGVSGLGAESVADFSPFPTSRFSVPVDSGSLAYVIYTSGSTGQPKGAMNSHGAILNRLHWMQEAYGLTVGDRVLQKTPLSFDVSVWELFWPLLFGARLVMAQPGAHGDPQYLGRVIRQRNITTLHFVPSMLAAFLDGEEVGKCTSLRRVICSGEALAASLRDRFFEAFSPDGPELHNLYGPTEAAVDVTAWQCFAHQEGAVPIGRPIANTRIHVLDAASRSVAVGAAGQLYIGGANLGRGYLKRPGLTAERFVPDPFGGRQAGHPAGGRLYATGDEVRLRTDGAIDFLGRLDFQVKLRGLRIELGEIETALDSLPMVSQSVAAVQSRGAGDDRLIAYLQPTVTTSPQQLENAAQQGSLRRELGARLPEYMVPSLFQVVAEFPLTPNGKVNRKALAALVEAAAASGPAVGSDEPEAEPAQAQARRDVPIHGLESALTNLWRDLLGIDHVGPEENFFDLGGHSLLLVKLQSRLQRELEKTVSLVDLFRFPTVRALADHLEGPGPARQRVSASASPRGAGASGPIAVLAASGRFPGAGGVEELWQKLCGGEESISFFTPEELEDSTLVPVDRYHPNWVRAGGVLEDIDLFDAGFFGLTPREAEILDPQQRLFLECSWEALESAGYQPEGTGGRVGVFAGVGINTYLQGNLMANPQALQAAGAYQAMLANDKDFLATRVSYKLGLKGPSFSVQTACSTSLVAIHLACRALRAGDCEMALAGGVTVRLPQRTGYLYEPSMILSPDGHCRPFSAQAAGTVGGNGVGVVALKPLDQALADGDPIVAVIRGSAVNNDGAEKVGFTAPGIEGQGEVVAQALADAGVDARSLGYVEAHGTGTELGDPIEIAALSEAFQGDTEDMGFCAIGSVKGNLGHLDAAAGVTGLIKAALALDRKQIPPSLHCETPNPAIDFAGSPFFVNRQLTPWEEGRSPRRAGVSSFGIGGTNAHVVLEEGPPRDASGPSRPVRLLIWSARTPEALEAAGNRLGTFLSDSLENSDGGVGESERLLADVAYTLQVGRQTFQHRRMWVTSLDPQGVAQALKGEAPEGIQRQVRTVTDETSRRPVAFLFPGQGSQFPGMGEELYHLEPTFRYWVDLCGERLLEPLGFDLRELLFPLLGADREECAQRLRQTRIAQPALFTLQIALAHLWQEWGMEPRALLGHSIGELSAAYLAGVFSLEDALDLVALRGRLMQELPEGSMLAVALSEAELSGRLERSSEDLDLAAINGPEACVVSGPSPAVAAFAEQLERDGVEHRRLHTSHAFHSSMMTPAVAAFEEAVAAVPRQAPAVPFLSNLSGDWITSEEATRPGYWAAHLRGAVRFAAGAERLLEIPDLAMVELGPGRTLTSLMGRQPTAGDRWLVPTLPGPKDPAGSLETTLTALGRLWQSGVPVDWQGFYRHEHRHRRTLPTYPFERRRYWVEPSQELVSESSGGTRKLADWFYLPSWRRSDEAPGVLPQAGEDSTSASGAGESSASAGRAGLRGPWLLLSGVDGIGDALSQQLRERGEKVFRVTAGSRFERLSESEFVVAPRRRQDYRSLLEALEEEGTRPRRIVHLWGMAAGLISTGSSDQRVAAFEGTQVATLYSVLALAQEFVRVLATPLMEDPGGEDESQEAELCVAASGLFRLDARDTFEPFKSTVAGALRVIQQEAPALACRAVDLPVGASGSPPGDPQTTVSELLDELLRPPRGGAIALRGGARWVESFEPRRIEAGPRNPRLRRHGAVLITGGLGGVALALAGMLARESQARLVLVGRSTFPPPEDWASWLANKGEKDPVSFRIRQLQALEEAGAELYLDRADVADRESMGHLVRRWRQRLGGLHGVIHAAGIAGDRAAVLLDDLDEGACREQFRSKVHGLLVLDEILGEESPPGELDFLAVTSSTATVLGGLGFTAYAAANSFVDAFVQARHGEGKINWLSIDWDGWSLGEGAVSERDREMASVSIGAEEGGEAFRRILGLESLGAQGRIVVAKRSLAPQLEHWLDIRSLRREAGPAKNSTHERPAGIAAYLEPSSSQEIALAEIWEDLLGIQPVGRGDDFFELGGHSLLATRLLTRVRADFGAQLGLATVFENPVLGDLAAKLALASGDEGEVESPVERQPRDQPMRLSFAQERMWFLFQLDPEGIAYNLPAAVRMVGDLDVGALSRTYGEVVRRHEILRTRFVEQKGVPLQLPAELERAELPLVDLSGLDRESKEGLALNLAKAAGRRPFDLVRGEVFRNLLLRVEEQQHVWVSVCHHIVTDGWSGGINVQEIAALYPALVAGRPSPLKALPFQYADFAHWQRQWLQGERLEALLEFWRGRLGGQPELLELPTDRPRGEPGGELRPSPAGRAAFIVSGEVISSLQRLAQKRDCSLFMTLMAALKVLFYRYTEAVDISVGTPVASRHVAGTEKLLGLFINTLVLRTDLGGGLSFEALLERERQVCLEAFAHQDLPFDKLVEVLQPEPASAGRELVRTLMAFNHEPLPQPSLPGLDLEILDLADREDQAMFDLAFGLTDAGHGLEGSVQYNSALFDDTTIHRWMGNFGRLLASISEGPSRGLGEFSLLSPGEAHQLEVEWPRERVSGDSLGRLAETAEEQDRFLLEALGDEPAEIVVVSELGRLMPLGAFGRLRLTSAKGEEQILAVRGRSVVEGTLRLAAELAPPGGPTATPTVGRREVADQRWQQVEDRKAKLSEKRRQLLRQRLAGKRPALANPALASREDVTLVRIQPHGERPPLFCVHAIAGDVTNFLELAELLGDDQPFFGLQAPGLGGRQMPFRTLQEMAAHYVRVVRKTQPAGPYYLGGWSMGAVVGYEMAQQLRQEGEEVAVLLLLEPSIPGCKAAIPAGAAVQSLATDLESLLGRRLPVSRHQLTGLEGGDQVSYLVELASRAGLDYSRISGQWSPHLLKVYETNLEVLQKYQPQPYEGRTVLVVVEDAEGPIPGAPDRLEFWSELVGPQLSVKRVEGNHTTMLRDPHVRRLAAVLRESLISGP
ncbi:MAG: amino acid adenylation domain-containing protein [Deltaproteobacteria bacterium]|nr:amino acid adenylation domain-containing protein [Deltaproteobacteria bacterium]